MMTKTQAKFDFDYMSDESGVSARIAELELTLRVSLLDPEGPAGWPVYEVIGDLQDVFEFAKDYFTDYLLDGSAHMQMHSDEILDLITVAS